MIPLDTSVEAEYEDGYILSETEHEDVAQFGDGNIFRDILLKRPEPEHGRMVRFTVFYQDQRYDIDWTTVPDNARPIRFRHGFATMELATGKVIERGWTGIDIGYQWNDESGANQQEVLRIGEGPELDGSADLCS